MKKEWSNPTISKIALKETKNHICPHKSDDGVSTFDMLRPEQCCPCTDPGIASCTKSWKYIGPCKS